MSTYNDASLILYPSGYKASKLYSLKPTDGSGDLDVVRATTATRVNSDGLIEEVAINVPRIDYTGGGCGKLLLEPQRTNLALYSEEFDNVVWIKPFGTVSANVTTAPDGTSTADKYIINNGAPANSSTIQFCQLSPNTTYTLSVFVKKSDYNTADIRIFTVETGFSINNFNLQSGTATNNQIQSFGNGWFRIWITLTTLGTVSNSQVQLINNAEIIDGVSGIFLWGAQLEEGSYPTSYIPTVAAAVTRNADQVSKTGISSLIGQTEGTLYVEVDTAVLGNVFGGTSRRLLTISDETTNNRIIIFQNLSDDSIAATVSTSGITQFSSASAANQSGVKKIAVGYANNDFVLYINGVQIATSASGSVPACSRVGVGSFETSANTANAACPVSQALILPTRLSNSELETLTTL